jgi:hypothetical protein
MKTQVLLLSDTSNELIEKLEKDGPIQCMQTPPVQLARTPKFEQYWGNVLLSPDHIRGINTSLKSALTCTSNASELPSHELELVAIALQLVKPTRDFCKYCVMVDDNDRLQQATAEVQFLHGMVMSDPYLRYQQHHTITASDVTRAIQLIPTLLRVLEQGHGSWVHPFGSIHRAVIFFAQGYSAGLHVLRQVLWAAGLDCLFASKLNRSLQGSKAHFTETPKTLWPRFQSLPCGYS